MEKRPDKGCFFWYNKDATLAQEVEHRRGKEEVPSSNLGSGFDCFNKPRKKDSLWAIN